MHRLSFVDAAFDVSQVHAIIAYVLPSIEVESLHGLVWLRVGPGCRMEEEQNWCRLEHHLLSSVNAFL